MKSMPMLVLTAALTAVAPATASATAYTWGSNDDSQLGDGGTEQQNTAVAVTVSGVLSGKSLTHLGVGRAHSCAVADGKAYCWGDNFFGQLGDDSTTPRSTAVAVSAAGVLSGKTLTQISAGQLHTCALSSEGKVYCWGDDFFGQLGNAATTTVQQTVPVEVTGALSGKTVTQISAGPDFSCAVAAGKAYCWGYGVNGQLGNSSTDNQTAPVAVTEAVGVLSGKTVTYVSAGGQHSCAIADGTAYCWGKGGNGQLGNSDNSDIDHQETAPVAVTAASGLLLNKTLTQISTGSSHSCAIADGKAYCWGNGGDGRLGNGASTDRNAPVAVTASGALSGKTLSRIATGNAHSCAIADGKAYCWGDNLNGQLGIGSTTDQPTPVAVTATGVLKDKLVTQISAGATGLHTAVLAAEPPPPPVAWGNGYNGQLGNGGKKPQTAPVAVITSGVLAGKTVTQIGAGIGHTCAVADGKAYCWGFGLKGQLGNGGTVDVQTTPVAVTDSGVLSGKTLTQISVGQDHSCALDSDGKVYCWGKGGDGALGNGSTTNSLVPVAVTATGVLSGTTLSQIAAGANHTCALDNTGKAYCWGNGIAGQIGNDDFESQLAPVAVSAGEVPNDRTLTQISAGEYHTCALDSAGKAYCWGDGSEGKLGLADDIDNTFTIATPQAVSTSGALSGKTLTQISTGRDHACALDSAGKAFCWGSGSSGRLGNGGTSDTSRVTAVTDSGVLMGKTLTQISAGELRTCALDSAGKVYCWGVGYALGNGSTANSLVPVAVTDTGVLAGGTVTKISTGSMAQHTLALTQTDGDADGDPVAFTFTDLYKVAAGKTQTSKPVTITGSAESWPISVTGGEYAIGCNKKGFTTAPGTLLKGQKVCVRHTSSALGGGVTDTVLDVGGVKDTFSSTAKDSVLSVKTVPASIDEAGGVSTLTFTLKPASVYDVSIALSVNGSATYDEDYTLSVPATEVGLGRIVSLDIPAGETSATLTATGVDDAAVEKPETVELATEGVTGIPLPKQQKIKVTIKSED